MSTNSALSTLRAHYARAAELLLLRRLDEAETACERALGQLGVVIKELNRTTRPEQQQQQQPRHRHRHGYSHIDWTRKLWLLRIALTSAQLEEQQPSANTSTTLLAEQLVALYNRIRNSYAEDEDIHPDIIAALEMLALKLEQPDAARTIAETWLANLTDTTFEAVTRANSSTSMTITNSELSDSTVLLSHSTEERVTSRETSTIVDDEEQIEHNQMKKGYERVIELYTLHALPQLNEWETSQEFLNYNDMLHTSTQKTYMKSLKRLRKASIKAASRDATLKEEESKRQMAATATSPSPSSPLPNDNDTSWMESTWISASTSDLHQDTQASVRVYGGSSTSSSPSSSLSSLASTTPVDAASSSVTRPATNTTSTSTSPTSSSTSRRNQHTTRASSSVNSWLSWLRRQRDRYQTILPNIEQISYLLIVLFILSILQRVLLRQPMVRRLWRQVWQKFMQTVKMGTTVTYV